VVKTGMFKIFDFQHPSSNSGNFLRLLSVKKEAFRIRVASRFTEKISELSTGGFGGMQMFENLKHFGSGDSF
jgi:hypothetical protein